MKATRGTLLLVFCVLISAVAGAQTEWVDHPDNPVIEIEDPGDWAPGGAWVTAALLDGTTYHLWFTGLTADGSYTEAGIGHATSSDGVEWTMDPANPVLTRGPDGDWDDEWALGPAVVRDAAGYHMWYTGGDGNREHLGYATSPDGSAWTKYADNPVLESGPPGAWDYIIGPSAVVVVDGTYRMWFYGSDGSDYNGQIGYAESGDGISWNKYPAPVLEPNRYPGSWVVQFLSPTVVFDGTTYHLWYGGNSPTEWTEAGYAFSADGIEWTQHRGNPVHGFPGKNIDPVVVLDGSTFHMWYLRYGIPPDSGATAYATSVCCAGVAALDNWRVIPAAAVASGAQGSFYQTDVDLNNASDQPVEYEFLWFPRGETNTEPVMSETFSLGAGMSVRYANALTEVFGLEPNSFGAIGILASSSDLLAMSRTYNNPAGEDAGTFGQAIPAVPPDDFIPTGERRRLLFASENSDLRFNVGCQSGGDGTMVVNLELFDDEGTSLGTEMMILRAWGNDQLNRVFEDYMPVNGYVDVSTTLQNKSFYCYGSVLDNVTSDPTTVLPQ